MRFAFSKPTANEDETRTLLTQFRQAGYDGLQLKSGQYMPYLAEPGRFLQQWGSQPGVASALIVANRLDDMGVEQLRRLFGFGKAVGTELVVFCHGVSRKGLTPSNLCGFARRLSQLGKEAKDRGLKLSLHHHYDQPVMLREDLDVFFGAVHPGAVGLTVDTAHLVKSGVQDVAGLIRHMAPVIDNFHMKDFASGEFKVLGEGKIDFAPIFAAVREIGYDGWVSADEESGAELLSAMDHCHRFMKQGLQG